MQRARFELLAYAHYCNAQIKCALIQHDNNAKETASTHALPVGYTSQQYNDFIDSLDFVYDNSAKAEELTGIVWFTDGTWLIRMECDGIMEWEHCYPPKIPDILQPSIGEV